MPHCQLSKEQLKEVMKYQLKHFNLGSKDITDNTKHSDILSDDGSNPTSKKLYESLIRYTIKQNGCKDKDWPANWMDLTVAELTDQLI